MWIFSILQKHAYNRSLNHCVPSCSKRCDTTSLLPMGTMVVASFVICASLRYQEWVEVFQTSDETNIGMKSIWNQQALDVAMSLSVLLAKHRKTWPATGQWLVSSLNSRHSIQKLHLAAEKYPGNTKHILSPTLNNSIPWYIFRYLHKVSTAARHEIYHRLKISFLPSQTSFEPHWLGKRKSTQLLGSFKRRKKQCSNTDIRNEGSWFSIYCSCKLTCCIQTCKAYYLDNRLVRWPMLEFVKALSRRCRGSAELVA